MVEILNSRRLRPPLRNRVRSEHPERRSHPLNAEMLQVAIECHAIAVVMVVNQKPWSPSIPSAALHYLLGRRLRRRKWRYRNMQDFPVLFLATWGCPKLAIDIARLPSYPFMLKQKNVPRKKREDR